MYKQKIGILKSLMKMATKIKIICIIILLFSGIIFFKSIESNSLSAFEKNFKKRNIEFFDKKINELKGANEKEILNFNLKMSMATNTLFVDHSLIEKVKKTNIDLNLLRQNSISFWRKEIATKAFFDSTLKDKQKYFIYNLKKNTKF